MLLRLVARSCKVLAGGFAAETLYPSKSVVWGSIALLCSSIKTRECGNVVSMNPAAGAASLETNKSNVLFVSGGISHEGNALHS